MRDLLQLEQQVLQNGKIEGHEIEILRQQLFTDGKIDRREAEFLIELHKRVQRVTPAFEKFFFQAIKSHVLIDGTVKPPEVRWLRERLFADPRKMDDLQRRFLTELRGEAKQVCPEFLDLCQEWLK